MIDGGGVDLLFANEDEALQLTGAADLDSALDELSDKVPTLVVTCGAEGAIGGRERRARSRSRPRRSTQVVDTTGAGDLFAAGFLVGTLQGREPRALPVDRRDRRGRGDLAFRRAARGRPEGTGAAMSMSSGSPFIAARHRAPIPPSPTRRARSARTMAERGIDLVYGGGRLGLMGIVADAVLDAGGKVYGVIPQALVDLEVAHTGCTELHIVANMHERKAKMTELTDAFVALPGGIGTLDELFEAWTLERARLSRQAVLPAQRRRLLGRADRLHGPCRATAASCRRRGARNCSRPTTPGEAIDLLDEAAKSAAQGVIW